MPEGKVGLVAKIPQQRVNNDSLTKQVFHVFAGKAFDESVIIRNKIFCQQSFSFLELKDLVFNTILADHAVSKNVLGLANPVSPVNGLLFHRRIPPGIHDIDIVSGRKV